VGKVVVTGGAGCGEFSDSRRLLTRLDEAAALDGVPASDDTEATELMEPLRLLGADDVPPKPLNPSVAGRDSSGNNSPVLVIFESHIRW